MADLIREMPHYEPLMTNRWLVRTKESFTNIPAYTVKDFRIDTVDIDNGKKKDTKALKLTLHFHNLIHWLLVPDDVMYAKKIIIDFLDPTGVVVNYYTMNVEFDTFTLAGDYSDSDILTHEVTFWIKNMESLSSRTLDEKTVENYRERVSGNKFFDVFNKIVADKKLSKRALDKPSEVFTELGLEVSDCDILDKYFFEACPNLEKHFKRGAKGNHDLKCSSPKCDLCLSATMISAGAAIGIAIAGFPEDTPAIEALADLVGVSVEDIEEILEGTKNVADVVKGICRALGTC
jgi:hypothetical protein